MERVNLDLSEFWILDFTTDERLHGRNTDLLSKFYQFANLFTV